MSCANLNGSGTDGAKFPMVDVGQVTVLWAAHGAVSCLEIAKAPPVLHVLLWRRHIRKQSEHLCVSGILQSIPGVRKETQTPTFI